MGKRIREEYDHEFEDFGYTIQNKNRVTRKRLPKLKRENNDGYDTLETDHN
jgi:hypothetical protein